MKTETYHWIQTATSMIQPVDGLDLRNVYKRNFEKNATLQLMTRRMADKVDRYIFARKKIKCAFAILVKVISEINSSSLIDERLAILVYKRI